MEHNEISLNRILGYRITPAFHISKTDISLCANIGNGARASLHKIINMQIQDLTIADMQMRQDGPEYIEKIVLDILDKANEICTRKRTIDRVSHYVIKMRIKKSPGVIS